MKIICFWALTGENQSALSFEFAQNKAKRDKTLLVELPCLGIPRLAYLTGLKDRIKNTEGAILHFQRFQKIREDFMNHWDKNLYILPASVYEDPDIPIEKKMKGPEPENFLEKLCIWSREQDFSYLIFDLQGQLYHPMTFFALKKADQIYAHLPRPEDLTYVLSSVSRLNRVYKVEMEKIFLLYPDNPKPLEKILKKEAEWDQLRILETDCFMKEERKNHGF